MKSLYQTVLVVLMGSLIASACVPNRPPRMTYQELEGEPDFTPTANGCGPTSEKDPAKFGLHRYNRKIAYSPDDRWVVTTEDVPFANEVHLYDRMNKTKVLIKHPSNKVFLEDFSFDLTSSKLSFSASFQFFGGGLAEVLILDLEEASVSRLGKMGEALSHPLVLEDGSVLYLKASVRKGAEPSYAGERKASLFLPCCD